MAIQATTPAEVAKVREYETERVAVRAKLAEAKDEKVIRDLNQQLIQIDADETNSKRSGIGTRIHVGQTRGKNPVIIQWEAFDDSQPETLPTSIKGVMEVTGVKDEPTLTKWLIVGANDANYTAASDPLAEFVEQYWPDEAQNQFRIVVRNYARGIQTSLEEAVALIKPGFDKQYPKPVVAVAEQPATETAAPVA